MRTEAAGSAISAGRLKRKGVHGVFARTYGGTTLGVDGLIIDVEVDASAGLPAFDIVGLPDTAVKESKERVRTAIRNSGIVLRQEKVTVNLAPAGIHKDSPGLDLPIAVGLLAAYGMVDAKKLEKTLMAGELSLEGECRPVRGVLPMTVQAKEQGFERVFVPAVNATEALLVGGIQVYGVHTLLEVVQDLTGEKPLQPAKAVATAGKRQDSLDDFADVQGQFAAKRALEIAAAGGHNILMVGVPGAGKTMLARRLNSILPGLTREEALEVTKIYSIAGLLPPDGGLLLQRPFRSPHHTASMVAMIGGGRIPRPGEVTLAHHGVLFLDELPEFNKTTLEVLRQPLEDRKVTISRVHATLTFPASFILVAAMNPCPCGYHGDASGGHTCACTPAEIRRYTRKLSGPLLDRIDIHIRVPRVSYQELTVKRPAESSAAIRERVTAARQRQWERLGACGIFSNAQMNHRLIQQTCSLSHGAQKLLEAAFSRMKFSARSYDRILKVSRTIADLSGQTEIWEEHVGEAIQLRSNIDGNVD